jgi:hypothetical protein
VNYCQSDKKLLGCCFGELSGNMEAARRIYEARWECHPKQHRTSKGKVQKSGTEEDALWQKLHSHAYTHATVCSFVSFTHYLIYLRRWSAKKIRLWHCLLHHLFPYHSW